MSSSATNRDSFDLTRELRESSSPLSRAFEIKPERSVTLRRIDNAFSELLALVMTSPFDSLTFCNAKVSSLTFVSLTFDNVPIED